MKNTGKLFGDEVVQLYVAGEKSRAVRPEKKLGGFERVPLHPNQTKTIKFEIPAKDLAFWDTSKKAFVTETGNYSVMVGSSSMDIRATGKFKIK